MSPARIHIPKPCPVSQEALTPSEAGWHCARCRTEVVDFTRLSEAEVRAYLAARPGQRVCAAMQVPLAPQHPKRPRGPRRWLLAVAALLGWQPASALPPQPLQRHPLSLLKPAASKERVVIRGVVLDDSLHVSVPNADIFIKDTRYGTVTNERGEFSLSFDADWPPASQSKLVLEISAGHFTFSPQVITVSFSTEKAPTPLTVRLRSLPGRGFIKGKVKFVPPPTTPPGPVNP